MLGLAPPLPVEHRTLSAADVARGARLDPDVVRCLALFDVLDARGDLRQARRDRRYYAQNGRRYYRDANGAEVFVGLIAGALAAGAAAAAQGADAVAYCESRFRSYDRASGTYLGYDGLRHACP